MKEFKKWWKTYRQKWSLNEHYAKEGWKAALKWANSNKSYEMADAIYEELGE